MLQGIVTSIDLKAPYGFISPDGGGDDIFFHSNGCASSFDEIRHGALVQFDMGTNSTGPCAVGVTLVSPRSPLATEVTGFVSTWLKGDGEGVVTTDLFGDVPFTTKTTTFGQMEPIIGDVVRIAAIVDETRWSRPRCVSVEVVYRSQESYFDASALEAVPANPSSANTNGLTEPIAVPGTDQVRVATEEVVISDTVKIETPTEESPRSVAVTPKDITAPARNPWEKVKAGVKETWKSRPIAGREKPSTRPERFEGKGFIGPVDWKPGNLSNQKQSLHEFAYCRIRTDWLKELRDLAQEEPGDWDYLNKPQGGFPILESYLRHTFIRVREQGQVLESADGSSAAFDTGLKDKYRNHIYAGFFRNPRGGHQRWRLSGFFTSSDVRFLMKFGAMAPKPARYIDDPSDLVFNVHYSVYANTEHIIRDNIKRFPKPYCDNPAEALNIIRNEVERLPERIHENYRNAIPQWYRPRGGEDASMQLLVPVYIQRETDPDVVLALGRLDGAYRVNTVLTVEYAYNNARLIAKPASDWLLPIKGESTAADDRDAP